MLSDGRSMFECKHCSFQCLAATAAPCGPVMVPRTHAAAMNRGQQCRSLLKQYTGPSGCPTSDATLGQGSIRERHRSVHNRLSPSPRQRSANTRDMLDAWPSTGAQQVVLQQPDSDDRHVMLCNGRGAVGSAPSLGWDPALKTR